jgi:hypothetical protein
VVYSRSSAITKDIKLCTYCGKRHMASCALRIHPDANDDTSIEWADSAIGKAILAAGYGKGGIEMRMRWDGARKKLVPMEKAAADEMLKSIPEKPQAGKTTVINNLDTTMTSTRRRQITYDHRAAVTATVQNSL